MKQRINFLTLGVNDLEKSLRFLRDGFGWQTQGIIGTEYERGEVVIFDLSGGVMLSLYKEKTLPGTAAWNNSQKVQLNFLSGIL